MTCRYYVPIYDHQKKKLSENKFFLLQRIVLTRNYVAPKINSTNCSAALFLISGRNQSTPLCFNKLRPLAPGRRERVRDDDQLLLLYGCQLDVNETDSGNFTTLIPLLLRKLSVHMWAMETENSNEEMAFVNQAGIVSVS